MLSKSPSISTVQKGQGGQPPLSPFGKNLQKITPAVHNTFVIFLTTMTGTSCHISISKASKII
jgi:hypothetical protein